MCKEITMATKKVYDACCERMQHRPLWRISGNGGEQRMTEPDMRFLFGKKELVSEVEFAACSEIEKRRHLREDFVLRSLYLELDPDRQSAVIESGSVAHTAYSHTVSKQFTLSDKRH